MHKSHSLKFYTLFCLSLLAGFQLFPNKAALAGNFTVFPIQVFLNAKVSNQLMTLKNTGSESLRLQVSAYAWNQTSTEDLQLVPSDDLVFFPSLFSLEPGQEQKVRVGILTPPADTEKTYRLIFQQLPAEKTSVSTHSAGPMINFLVNLSVPLFLAPPKTTSGADLTGVTLQNGKLNFQVVNQGNVHLKAQTLKVQGLAADGKVIVNLQREGWYILAGHQKQYHLSLPKDQCADIRSLLIEVQTDKTKKSITSKLETPGGACGAF